MKKLILMLGFFTSIFMACNEEPLTENIRNDVDEVNRESGSVDGVTYALNDICINKDIVVINRSNSSLYAKAADMENHIFDLSEISSNLKSNLTEGTVIYLEFQEYTGLHKIKNVKQKGENEIQLITETAHLGELFEEGSIEIELNLLEATKANIQKSKSYSSDEYYEILRLIDEYQLGNGITINPGIYLDMQVKSKLGFAKSQILPSEFSVEFIIRPEMSPLISFSGSLNQKYSTDIATYVPDKLLDLIRQLEFDVEIPVNMLGIEKLPVKISIQDIRLPVEIEATLSQESIINYELGNAIRIGYSLLINGLNIQKSPIYENNMSLTPIVSSDVYGEIITNNQIIITPQFTVLNNLYNVSGEISMGVKTITNGNLSLPDYSQSGTSSKGTFTANMNMEVDLLLTTVNIDIINIEKDIWDLGAIEKTLTLSDLQWKVTSSYSSNILLLSRLYETNFSLGYSYPIKNKLVPEELFISYEVYQDDGKTLITSEKDKAIKVSDITNNSFSFKLNIPYRSKLLSYQTKSYLKILSIKDHNGYEASGVYNSATGEIENSFLIQR